MGRFIDADALIEEIRNGHKVASFNYFLSLVQAQPTAYDKEKVVAEIRKQPFGNYGVQEEGEIIDIVRKGGVE